MKINKLLSHNLSKLRYSLLTSILLPTTLKNSLLLIHNKRYFSSSPVLYYPDGGDDFSSCPDLINDGYYDNGRGLDNDGNYLTP